MHFCLTPEKLDGSIGTNMEVDVGTTLARGLGVLVGRDLDKGGLGILGGKSRESVVKSKGEGRLVILLTDFWGSTPRMHCECSGFSAMVGTGVCKLKSGSFLTTLDLDAHGTPGDA